MRRGLLALLLVPLLAACRGRKPEPPPPPPPAPAPAPPAQVKLVAVGDILMHQDVKTAATVKGGFEPLWAEVSPLLREADLAFGNLETPVAPTSGGPGQPFLFNAPATLPEALKASGFTLLNVANNHAYDQGPAGVKETLERLDAAGLVVLGGGPDRPQAMAPRILERNGIRIAFLGWASFFNRPGYGRKTGPAVNLLNLEEAAAAVREARTRADAVVVSLHWGVEDQHEPTPRQREVAARLFEAGADLILGHHPHVLQPLEVSATGGRKVAVIYSLGNFISNQARIYDGSDAGVEEGDERDGAALVATFRRESPDRVQLADVDYVPLWTENNWTQREKDPTLPREIQVVRLDRRQGGLYDERRERIRATLAPLTSSR